MAEELQLATWKENDLVLLMGSSCLSKVLLMELNSMVISRGLKNSVVAMGLKMMGVVTELLMGEKMRDYKLELLKRE